MAAQQGSNRAVEGQAADKEKSPQMAFIFEGVNCCNQVEMSLVLQSRNVTTERDESKA